ncbi:helix-turn-helix domain-containing protein, partial [Alcanivoracaceae bacterium MT1]
ENYKEDIYIGLLANQVSMSLSSFSKAFKKETGKTPSEYLVQLRMREAKEILCNTNSTIKETAQFVGFQDEFYFSKVFKKYEGIAPTIFVRQSSERIAIVSQMFLQDHLLSLGIKPVAAPCYPKTFRTKNGFPSYISNKLSGTKPINVEEAVQMEEVLKVSPNTNFKMNLHHEPSRNDWKQGTDAIHIQHLPTWDSYLLTLASHTKRETKAEIVLSDMENKERAARETLLPVTRKGKWVVAWVRNNEIRLYGRSGHALSDLFYEKLGFIPDEKINHEGFQYIQLEDLVHLNPERILFMWGDTSSLQNLKTNKLWNELRAVYENNVFVPKSTDWDPWGPYGRDYTIQGFVSFFRSFC